jgi:DNA mismatch repair protein MutL
MAKIQVLDPLTVSKIAAGEVIERPASVVKELIENSIDAAASEVQLSIKNGGKDLIEIKDNGSGITSKDLPLSIKRHSTSKIRSEKDLDAICTMGFRGEALYSIASVSRFAITSRTSDEELANKITVEGDIDKYQITEEVMAGPGTIIRVQDLFFNYNVRRKFLKQASIEQSNIFNIIAQYAVAHPEISFTYIIENKTEFKTIKGHNHLSAIKEVFGRDLADALFDIGIFQRGQIEIQGYLSKSGHHKRNRKYQFFYLNGRRIYSKILQSSLEEGYGKYLMKGEFPIAFLFIETDPSNFDVNIHPQKREVLFYDENSFRTAISSSVSHSLKAQNIVPQFTPASDMKIQQTLDSIEKPVRMSNDKSSSKIHYSNNGSSLRVHKSIEQSELPIYSNIEQSKVISSISPTKAKIDLFRSDLKYRGQLGKEFILFEDISTNDLILLDFHAAHERINLEKITGMYKVKKVATQTFLKPFCFSINSEQMNTIKKSISLLNDLGIDLRIPKNETKLIEVYSIPKIIMKTDLKPFLQSLFDTLPSLVIQEHIDEIFSLIACHSSYRAGETITFRQAKEILTELGKTENPAICAHGRPTHIRITYRDFLKQVRRT